MKSLRAATWIMIIGAVFFLGACSSGGGGSDSTSSITGDTGTLSLKLVDKTTQEYAAVYVTIKEVQVCMETGNSDGVDEDAECEWKTIETLNKTYNLLDLVNGVMATLGQKDLEPGTYNQMRLLLLETPDGSSNINNALHPFPQYLIDKDGEAHEMKVPSGYQSGIKLVRQFEIVENLTTELILDFDVARSVVKAGNSGKYILKPTIKVIGTKNRATVSGFVTGEGIAEGDPLVGAQVSVQKYDSGSDTVIVVTNTTTNDAIMKDEYGSPVLDSEDQPIELDYNYLIYLDPDRYNIVVTYPGYMPACATVDAKQDGIHIKDFDLVLAPIPDVPATVEVTIIGNSKMADDETLFPVIELSFQQLSLCEEGSWTQTYYLSVFLDENSYEADSGNFTFTETINDFPLGVYRVVASTPGLDSVMSVPVLTVDETGGTFPITCDFGNLVSTTAP